jgi:hypothetical protein
MMRTALMPDVSLQPLRVLALGFAMGHAVAQAQPSSYNPFLPMQGEWPTPTERRLASGAPGPDYWQQSADYKLDIQLDDERQRISGKGSITYSNNSPHTLYYLWVQLDQNEQNPHALSRKMASQEFIGDPGLLPQHLSSLKPSFQGGMEIAAVTDTIGNLLDYTIVETNMRILLPQPLKPGGKFKFKVDWAFAINNARTEGRSGYEYFPSDGNYIYEIAQFYPRMCVYDDIQGWQNTPYLGPSEFSLEFGDFDVRVTVPDDHLVAGTGELVNADAVLSKKQIARLDAILEKNEVVDFVVNPKEAALACETKSKGSKTWVFRAEHVRDFAFASSRRFVWDAAGVLLGGKKVVAQSFYPKEAIPLWDKYATHAIIHTLKVYSRMTLDYPYAAATAVHGPVWGMEYPMICFCGGRPLPSGFYSRQTKYLMIGVIIHEVGHNFFPMVINNDERRWAWLDEGLNSFCQYVAEDEFEPNFPYRRGPADQYAQYARQPGQQPIMTNPDAIRDNGKISYEKVAVGLAILRNEVMGKALFDDTFREFARRWAFRRPEPSDFFRSFEDASGMNLDWFWREWFYGVGYVEMGISGVTHYKLPAEKQPKGQIDPHLEPAASQAGEDARTYYISDKSALKDRYTDVKQRSEDVAADIEGVNSLLEANHKADEGLFHVYQVRIKNNGSCIMPLRLVAVYHDGTRDRFQFPAEIWMAGNGEFVKSIYSVKEAVAFHLDPDHAIPDVDRMNNFFPNTAIGQKIQVHDLRQ